MDGNSIDTTLIRLRAVEDEGTCLALDYQNLGEGDLAAAAADGDEEAFAEMVRRFSPRVFRVCARFFRRHSLIEEAAQETFLRSFTQLGNFEARGSLEGWLTRIAATTCINIIRATKSQQELTISELTDDEANWLEDNLHFKASAQHQTDEDRLVAADLVARVLDTLPPEDVVVLTMMESEGASVRETAAVTGWSESKVKVRAFRARKRMREAVERLLHLKDGKLSRSEKITK